MQAVELALVWVDHSDYRCSPHQKGTNVPYPEDTSSCQTSPSECNGSCAGVVVSLCKDPPKSSIIFLQCLIKCFQAVHLAVNAGNTRHPVFSAIILLKMKVAHYGWYPHKFASSPLEKAKHVSVWMLPNPDSFIASSHFLDFPVHSCLRPNSAQASKWWRCMQIYSYGLIFSWVRHENSVHIVPEIQCTCAKQVYSRLVT